MAVEGPADTGGGEPADPVVSLCNAVFGWRPETVLLDIPALDVARGEKVFLRGPSGSGKSSLLGLLGGVLTARSGSVRVLGEDLARLSGAQRDALRAAHLGVIFQMFNLLPFLSLVDNVTLPCRFSAQRAGRLADAPGGIDGEARRLLSRLGLDGDTVATTPVRELSVGQQQRVAAARALIGGPALLIADEPTSALDTDARDAFLSLLVEECARFGSSLLFVSHDAGLAGHFDRTVDLAVLNRATGASASPGQEVRP